MNLLNDNIVLKPAGPKAIAAYIRSYYLREREKGIAADPDGPEADISMGKVAAYWEVAVYLFGPEIAAEMFAEDSGYVPRPVA